MTFLLIKLLLRWGVPQRFAGLAADGLIILLIGVALWAVHSHIWHAGYDAADKKWTDAQQAAQAKAQADSWQLVDIINRVDVSLSQDFAETNKTRTIYRDRIRTVAVDVYRDRQCDLPDSVWRDLNSVRAATSRPFAGQREGSVPAAGPDP